MNFEFIAETKRISGLGVLRVAALPGRGDGGGRYPVAFAHRLISVAPAGAEDERP